MRSFSNPIPVRSRLCSHGHEPLSPGMDYHSVLIHGQEVTRLDFCSACWEGATKEKYHETESIQWKASVPDRKGKSTSLQEADVQALDWLKEALIEDSEQSQLEAFVLALMLKRRRILVSCREVSSEKKEHFLLFQVVESEEMLIVPKVSLSQVDIQKVQQLLFRKIHAL